jgi:hypothetical protein
MADVKQYVNVDPAKPDERKELDAKRAGRQVVIEATVTPKKAGVRVYFEMKSTAKNIVPSLEEANFSDKKLKHLKGRAGGLPGRSIRSSLTDASGVAKLTVKLSEYGGDEFEVEAYTMGKGGKKKKSLKADKYIVWRRIYYQVSRFKAGLKGAPHASQTLPVPPKLVWANVEKEYKDREHNVEMIDETTTDLITRRANVIEADIDLKMSAPEGYDPKREPLAMRVVLVNQLADHKDNWLAAIINVSEGVPTSVTTPEDLWKDESLPETTDWLLTAQWRRDKHDAWKGLDRKFLKATGRDSFQINFTKIPKDGIFDFFRKAQVQVKLRYLKGSTNGLSWYNAIWLAAENMHEGARSEDAKDQTAIHETGHFIGMVAAGQSTHYTAHKHQGPHCSTGLSPAQKALLDYRGLGGTCVMFGENATTRKGVFCAVCDPSVRTRKVVLVKMPTSPASW